MKIDEGNERGKRLVSYLTCDKIGTRIDFVGTTGEESIGGGGGGDS